MATILLSTIGQQLGGPLGAVLGAAWGQGVDAALEGRRVGDLSLPVSSYGDPVPLAQGRVRVAGNLIWANRTPYRGKGDDGASASFALLLSCGPVRRLGRVWADGRVLRDADGAWAEPVLMRFHGGARGQMPDPLIAAAEGAHAPAYRGRAYAVFEDLDLSPFGNRIPALSFELEADGGGLASWAESLAARAGAALAADAVDFEAVGHTAAAPRARDALAPLLEAAGWAARPAGFGLRLARVATPRQVPAAERLGRTGSQAERARPARPPTGWSIAYLDAARDHQRGQQWAGAAVPGMAAGHAELPLALTADSARALAGRRLAEARAEAETLTLSLPWRWLHLVPGDRLGLADAAGGTREWRVRTRDVVGQGGLRVELRCTAAAEPLALPMPGNAGLSSPADAGRALSLALPPAPPTDLLLVTLPTEAGPLAGYWIAAGGAADWRGANIAATGRSLRIEQGRATRAAVAGRLGAPAGAVDAELLLRVADPEAPPWQALEAGANLLWLGGEAVRFADARREGELWRLSGVERGRLGTTASAHAARTPVARLDAAALLPLRWPAMNPGEALRLLAEGPGDPPGGAVADVVLP